MMNNSLCVICKKENPNEQQDFCVDLGCSGRLARIPKGYEIHFSQVNGDFSIWHKEPEAIRPELMADSFATKEDAIEYLLFP